MAVGIMEVTNASYRTTRAADAQCAELLTRLGWKVRYLPARLAIARSLSVVAAPPGLTADDEEDMSGSIRGQQLFGDGSDPAAWLALIVQRSGQSDLTKKAFQNLVAVHWKRGASLLAQDWDEANGNLAAFVARLAELASFSGRSADADTTGDSHGDVTLDREVIIPLGEIAEDTQSGDKVTFPMNAAGGSPHMAIMGGAGSGKTRTAVHMLKELRKFGEIPILVFDFKGDLAGPLAGTFGATVVSPPRMPVPLDVLHVSNTDDTSLREAAGRIRESIGRVKSSKLGGVQLDALREATLTVLRQGAKGQPANLAILGRVLEAEYQQRNRKPDELTATLNELMQFELFKPTMSPAEFFSRSWIIRLPQDGTPEVRRLIINLMLDALDRWLNALPDAPMIDGRRALRHLTMLDEAHVILSTKLPALSNLVRMSRSKGGAIMLISQSPDDFEGDEDGYLDNMGLTAAFSTQAKPGPTRAIFGAGASLVDLPVGQAVCRIRTDARTRRVIAWQP